MGAKKILFWINCYGAWDPEIRTPIETIGYDHYLDACAKAIALFPHRIEAVYLSGGQSDSLGRSECETVKPELEKRLQMLDIKIPIKVDELSITSISIMKKFLLTWKEEYPQTIPLIILDSARYVTNEFTFTEYCKTLQIPSLKVKNTLIAFDRMDNHPDSSKTNQRRKLEQMKEVGIDVIEQQGIEERKKNIAHKI